MRKQRPKAPQLLSSRARMRTRVGQTPKLTPFLLNHHSSRTPPALSSLQRCPYPLCPPDMPMSSVSSGTACALWQPTLLPGSGASSCSSAPPDRGHIPQLLPTRCSLGQGRSPVHPRAPVPAPQQASDTCWLTSSKWHALCIPERLIRALN